MCFEATAHLIFGWPTCFWGFLNSLILYNMSMDLPLPSWLVDISCLCFARIYFWMFFFSLRGPRKILLAYLFILVPLRTYKILPNFLLERKV